MNDSLPDPATNPTIERKKRPESCCCRIVVKHDMREAGESYYAPWWALFATRMLFGFGFIALIVVEAIMPSYMNYTFSPITLHFIIYSFCAITYLGLAFCTFAYGKGISASRNTTLSTIIVFLHSITAALSIHSIAEWIPTLIQAHIYPGFVPSAAMLAVAPVAYVIDVLVMRSRIRLRFRYAVFYTVLTSVYTAIHLTMFYLGCANCVVEAWTIGFTILGFVVIGFAASLIAVLFTRIPCCKKN